MTLIPALDDSVVLWSAEAPDRAGRPLLVLLHGYGSHEGDLFGLLPYLPPEFAVAAVRAPLAMPFPSPGHAWYPIDRPGGDPEIVTSAATRFIEWIDEAAGDAESVGLLGFSQGGAISVQAMRLRPERFAFAVNLSGFVAPGPALPGDTALAERRPPVFWGRGTHDTIINEALIAHTVEWLPAHTDLSGRLYEGLTHSVSEQELHDVRVFLDKQLENAKTEKNPDAAAGA